MYKFVVFMVKHGGGSIMLEKGQGNRSELMGSGMDLNVGQFWKISCLRLQNNRDGIGGLTLNCGSSLLTEGMG